MSCNYADGLSPYEHKGILGVPEKFDTLEKFDKKCKLLAQLIGEAKHVVVHTGAGISTSAGIPDFRGPNGVWTLEKKGQKPNINISFDDATPTKTHMILKKLVECNKVHYIVSQNIDGLHLKSGLPRKYLAELHGNMFIDECNLCKRQFIRGFPVETVGKKCSGNPCPAGYTASRPCRGKLYDGVLDWEHSLPENDLTMAELHSSIADLSICLGTTLQIVPSGNLPLETVKYGGKLVICNLQPTKHDNKADLVINYYVDDVLEKVMDILGIDIPTYCKEENPCLQALQQPLEWTIDRRDVLQIEKMFKTKCKGVKKKRTLIKKKTNSTENGVVDEPGLRRRKIIKLEPKEEKNNSVEVKSEQNGDCIEVKNEQNDRCIEVKNEQNNDCVEVRNEQNNDCVEDKNEQNDDCVEDKNEQNDNCIEVKNEQNDDCISIASTISDKPLENVILTE
ncbi:hypothetical protein PYW07_002685 [Mythimna separata]|uniref:protein acetyllysine N-acetyltransferase n=1 Tax=Mythimna separata TaxID=271217 RepID=A0AAD8DQN5_MYTSE|nr:hypothetical protein PYW07_002685 [Mythimna separata]